MLILTFVPKLDTRVTIMGHKQGFELAVPLLPVFQERQRKRLPPFFTMNASVRTRENVSKTQIFLIGILEGIFFYFIYVEKPYF